MGVMTSPCLCLFDDQVLLSTPPPKGAPTGWIEKLALVADASAMQRSEVKMYKPNQVSSFRSVESVFSQIKHATEVFFQRRLDVGAADSSIPGLEVTDSNWGEWEDALTKTGARKFDLSDSSLGREQ